jgi:hypothetical protein
MTQICADDIVDKLCFNLSMYAFTILYYRAVLHSMSEHVCITHYAFYVMFSLQDDLPLDTYA